MAEIVLSPIIQVLVDKLSSSDLIKFAREEKVHTSINEWKKMVEMIVEVLNDAEDKQITIPAVKKWLGKLQFLAHDAEDVLDLFATEILRRKLKAETQASTSKFKLRSIIPTSFKPSALLFNTNMGSKIKKITTGFEELLEQKRKLDLMVHTEGEPRRTRERQATPTTSVPESHVYGREEEKAAILKLVLSSEANDDHGVSVIPIVGPGGVGKTTIARLVYNDDRLKGYFNLKAWVCVSEEFEIVRVTKAILESFTKQAPDVTTLNSLQERLVEKLSNQKFLLVLDDVWLENYEDWTALHRPLEKGAPGSKIIVTTRNEGVSSLTGTIPSTYRLKHLSYDDCRSLFIHHASVDFDKHPSLRHICKEIVKRCKGLPLAAKALGGILRGKVDLEEWKAVLDSSLWELPEEKCEVLPVLRLSYHHLPPHLKQCFAFCAIFPKDYEFEEETLVLLWMAVGLVVKQGSKERHLEDVGGGYFRDLLSRSLFQRSSSLFQRSSSNKSMFVMHDLVNDLAQWVAGETTFRLEEKQSESSTKALHSSYIMSKYDGVKKFEAFDGLERLRTFLPLKLHYHGCFINDGPLKLLPKFKCLRALSLSKYDIVELPDSIGDLKHLRYFDLSYTRIKSLPESTSTLYNLQTLLLKGCYFLKKLPTEMHNLINLHHLDITGANSLQEMPPGIGKLMNLQTLSKFIVGNNGGLEIKELMGLNNLRRTLCISRLENVVHAWDAREARLKDKQDLDELTLQWSYEFNGSRNEGGEKEVLDMLQPHKKLKGLTIECYGGLSFSTWMGDPSFSNMVFLRLEDCGKSRSLPSVGKLLKLKDLVIKGMKEVNSVGIEFCGEGITKPFPSLEILRFEDMEEWKEWKEWLPFGADRQVDVFPQLRKLSVISCPKLLENIPDHLASLEELEIRGCKQLSVSISSFPKLCKLDIEGCQEMVQSSLMSMNSLKSVTLCDISKLTCVREEGFVKRLRKVKELKISGCEELACLIIEECTEEVVSLEEAAEAEEVDCRLESRKISGWAWLWQKGVGLLQHLTSLVHLRIEECTEEVVSLLEEAAEAEEVGCRLESLELIGCENLEKLQGLHSLTVLRELTIENCPRLVYFPPSGLPSTLRELTIKKCDSLKSVVRGGELPSMLKKLEIRNCKNLQWLVEEDSTMQKSNTTSLLEELEILECPCLTSLSSRGGELPATLKYVWITRCSMVESIAEEFCNDSSLEIIRIEVCESLKSLPKGLHNLRHLREIRIWRCPNLVLFRDGLVLPSANLRQVWIDMCEKVEALPNGMHNLNCLEELRIINCPGIISFPEEGFPTNLTTLGIYNLKINKLVLEWGLNRLTSLKQLWIVGGFPDLASFPPEEDGMLLPASLTELWIRNFPSLEHLSWKGFQNLNSLEQLSIEDCPKLKSFPKEGLPPSLLRLGIYRCPRLEEACEKNKGPDWPKIAHLPRVEINWRFIWDSEEEISDSEREISEEEISDSEREISDAEEEISDAEEE